MRYQIEAKDKVKKNNILKKTGQMQRLKSRWSSLDFSFGSFTICSNGETTVPITTI
ncbi:MAG: hypothetical protein UU47_C0003G0058 [candidate division TM6 bacterium GW2011_GWE2_41_16]|nr:MAG: hypothetical protein UU47_C0003G0058 [candidate division TM6 bacterium GW2011_GWE2_41_16]